MARYGNTARMGFFPLPQHAQDALIHAVTPSTTEGFTLIDPCAGEGVALEAFSKAWNMKAYAVEQNYYRHAECVEKFGYMNAVQGSAFNMEMSHNSFSVMYLNPPFSQSLVEDDSRREEVKFLEWSIPYIVKGGVLIFVCYIHHMTEGVYKTLFENFTNVQTYTVPGLDLDAYGMVVTLGNRKPDARLTKAETELAVQAAQNAQAQYRATRLWAEAGVEPDQSSFFPALDENVQKYSTVAPTFGRYQHFTFRPRHFSNNDLIAMINDFGSHNQRPFQMSLKPKPVSDKVKVVIAPSGNRLVNAIVEGLMNGVMVTTDKGRALVRAVTKAVEVLVDDEETESDDEEPSDDKTVVFRNIKRTTIKLLYESGEVEDITEDGTLADFVRQHKSTLVEYANTRFDADYNFDFMGSDALKAELSAITIKKDEEAFPLYTSQKHVVAATVAHLAKNKGMLLVGQQGTGKTAMASSLLRVMKPRASDDPLRKLVDKPQKCDQFSMVICPPHLVGKWERELRGIDPDAFIGVVKAGEGEKPIIAVNDFLRRMKRADKLALKVMIIANTMMKDGEGWSPAVLRRTTRAHQMEDFRQVLVSPMSGAEITETVGKDQKPMKFATLKNNRQYEGKRRTENHAKYRGKATRSTFRAAPSLIGDLDIQRDHVVSDKIRQLRAKADAALPLHHPLWQETRSKHSAPKTELGDLLAKAMGREKRVMPLPDLVQKHLPEHKSGMNKHPRASLDGVAKLIAQRYAHLLYMVVVDEAHEYQLDSDRAFAAIMLSHAATKTVWMTGTIFNGYARSLFFPMFVISPTIRARYGWEDRSKFSQDMGIFDRIVKIKSADATRSGRASQTTTIKELPGVTTLASAALSPDVIHFALEELGHKLPDFNEIAEVIQMDEQMRKIYDAAADKLDEYLTNCLVEHDQSFLGAYVTALLEWPNWPFDPMPVIHNKKTQNPNTGEWSVFSKEVMVIPGMGRDYITPKEKRLIEIVKASIAQGRGVGIYMRQTGVNKKNVNRNILNRIAGLLQEQVPNVRTMALTSSIPTAKREQWFVDNKEKNVLLCNPNTVKTGLDLYQFPDLVWLEIDYSLNTMEQASHRAWRIGQTKVCNVYYTFYASMGEDDVISADTMEAKGIVLMDKKRNAANFLYGREGTSLSAVTDVSNGSLLAELKKEFRNEMLVSGSSLFAKAISEEGAEAPEQATNTVSVNFRPVEEAAPESEFVTVTLDVEILPVAEPEVVIETAPEPVVEVAPVVTPEPEVAVPEIPTKYLSPDMVNTLWKQDVQKYGTPVEKTDQHALFDLKNGRAVVWFKNAGVYRRESLDQTGCVFRVYFQTEAAAETAA